MESRKPRVLIFDVETSDIELLIRTYQLKNFTSYFSPDTIKRDWTMLGAAWKWHGESKVHCISVSPKDIFNDYVIVQTLYEVLSSADVIIGHNSDNFDLKKFNTRALYYKMLPLHKKTSETVDTLKLARKYFKITSNKLSYIANYLGLESKDESPDWIKVMEGDEDELRYMREYNKKDVIVTEQIYDIMKGWDSRHPNIAVIANIKDTEGLPVTVCNTCLSHNLTKNGYQIVKSGKIKPRLRCSDCGATQYGSL